MTQANAANLFHVVNPLITTSGSVTPSASEIDALLDNDSSTTAITVGSSQTLTLDIDFQLPVSTSGTPLNKLILSSSTRGIEGSLTFSVSQGAGYTTASPVKTTYGSGALTPKTEVTATQNGTQSLAYSPVTGKLYRLGALRTVLDIYDPSTNTWSTQSLGLTLGYSPCVVASKTAAELYFTQGNLTSNFYKITLSPFAVSAMAPTPFVQPNGFTSGSALIGSTNHLVHDRFRNRIYWHRQATVGADTTFRLCTYDVNANSWAEITNVGTDYGGLAYAENIDKLVFLNYQGTVKYMSPYSFTWTTMATSLYTQPATTGIQYILSQRIHASYSNDKIYLNATAVGDSLVTGHPIFIIEYDPVTLTYKQIIYSASPYYYDSNASNAERDIVVDMDNKRGWTYTGQDTNILVDFSNPRSYYVDLSGATTPYRKARIAITAACAITQIKAETNSQYVGFTEDPSNTSYPYFTYGRSGTSQSFTVRNERGTTTSGSSVYIQADGSEASRYFEISDDNTNWIGHCTNNDLENHVCLASSSNYNTSSCFIRCNQFDRDMLDLGTITSSGTKTCYMRGRFPGEASRTSKEVSLSVEHNY